MHDAFIRCWHQTGKLLMCAPDMLHPFQLGSGLTMTYHDLPTAVFFWWCEVKRPEPICRSCGILILSATAKKWFRCLFELLVHLNPLRQGALRTGDSPDFIDGFLGHQMINESDSVKCRPGPISKLILHSQSQPSEVK